jgi:hypothetical protein
MVINDEHLQQWLFHYNPYTNIWSGFLRKHLQDYFNGIYTNVYTNTSFSKLLKEIKKNEKQHL